MSSGENGAGALAIPQEMREFAERSVEQARKAFDGLMNAAHRTVEQMDGVAAATPTGARAVTAMTIDFAEANVAASFAFAQRLTQAKDVGEIMALQAEFLAERMATMQAQARDLGLAVAHAVSVKR